MDHICYIVNFDLHLFLSTSMQYVYKCDIVYCNQLSIRRVAIYSDTVYNKKTTVVEHAW